MVTVVVSFSEGSAANRRRSANGFICLYLFENVWLCKKVPAKFFEWHM